MIEIEQFQLLLVEHAKCGSAPGKQVFVGKNGVPYRLGGSRLRPTSQHYHKGQAGARLACNGPIWGGFVHA